MKKYAIVAGNAPSLAEIDYTRLPFYKNNTNPPPHLPITKYYLITLQSCALINFILRKNII